MANTFQDVTNSDGLLKNMYDSMSHDIINLQAKTYGRMSVKKDFPPGGKGFVTSIKVQNNHGGGVRNEAEALPTPYNFQYQQPLATPKSSYQMAEVSGQAVERSGGPVMAFESVLKEALSEGAQVFARSRNHAIFRDGTSILAKTSAVTTGATTVTCDNLDGVFAIKPGMRVDIVDTSYPTSGAIEVDEIEVSTVDQEAKTFELASSQTIDTAIMDVVLAGNRATTKAKDILGFDAAFDDGTNTDSYFGVARTTFTEWAGNLVDGDNNAISLPLLQKAFNKIIEDVGVGKEGTLELCTNYGQEEKLADIVLPSQRTNDTMEYGIGWTRLMYKNMPVLIDTQCPRGKIYMINNSTINRHVLLDATWDNIAGLWFSHHGLSTGFDKFTAMLKCYEEVICINPHANCIIHTLEEPA